MVYSLLFKNLDSCNAIWSWILQNVDKNKHGTHMSEITNTLIYINLRFVTAYNNYTFR